MGANSFDAQTVRALKRLARANHFSVVVGAGASVPAGLPPWSRLIETLLARSGPPKVAGSKLAAALLQTQGQLLGAEAAFDDDMNAAERRRRIARALFQGKSRSDFEPSDLHFAIASMAEGRGPDRIELFTTNYDDLLERAFELSDIPHASRYDHQDCSAEGFTVHHLHGFLGRERRGRGYVESADLILAQSDYDRLYMAQNDWPGEALGQAAARGPLLFVSTSLTDPNLVRYLGRIKDRQLQAHVLILARQGLRVPYDLFPAFGDRLAAQWQKSNVEVLLVEDFADVTSFILELSYSGTSTYSPPLKRLRQFWRQINSGFRERQRSFACGLDKLFKHELQPLLGRSSTLELWLADGWGDLVCFAANDRVHRSQEALRRIPYRWDAGWAVTESVSFGNPVIRPIEQVAYAPEQQAPRLPWRHEAAVPIWVGGIGAAPPLIAGALVSSTDRLVDAGTEWIDKLEGLSLSLGVYLTKLTSLRGNRV